MTDFKPGDQAQWNWGQGHPTGTVTEVKEHGSISIQSANGNTITRNAEPSNPAVHLEQDGTDVVKRASELEKIFDAHHAVQREQEEQKEQAAAAEKQSQQPQQRQEVQSHAPAPEKQEEPQLNSQPEGDLHKPFPTPRQSAPITRPPDTAQEKEEANLSYEEQKRLAEERDTNDKMNGQDSPDRNSKENEEVHPAAQPTMVYEDKMDTREDNKAPTPEKQPTLEASVGDKRERSEEPPVQATASEEKPSATEKEESVKEVPAAVPEPESKKPRVEEEEPTPPAGEQDQDPTAPEAHPTDAKPEANPQGSAIEKPAEQATTTPKKKTKTKKDAPAVPPERRASIASRTRSKAPAEDISLTNDDGPPSSSSPFVKTFVAALRSAGHTVSVCIPADQKSWIGKAHIIGHHPHPTFYHPDTDETHETPSTDGREEWVLINGTPASCTQIGLFHLFKERGPIDLVVSGPNFGKNSSAVYALSSGTLGGSFEAALSGAKSISVSYAYKSKDNPQETVEAATRIAIKIIHHLYDNWPADKSVDLYSVNIPLNPGVDHARVISTHILQNTWGGCYKAIQTEEDDEDPGKVEKATREGTSSPPTDESIANKLMDKYKFKWAPRFGDVEKASKEDSARGSDAWALQQGFISVTPLKANYLHGPGVGEELIL
ncbi:hypothetical protein H072_1682 [Dactylellina haptotyla CBS 200.50]|uniref:Survival protein SurE-like phosphatase/nucleotidase domain-containing protein n=1 Tax=Dactylellina haptotyla (strain CBS 200.50) TaxID=1284197 RepID=S8ANB2_DACHA|nr:hypothetical protein H072_1682 [Dactylellina haptotyla CBS 200.50]